MQKALTLPADLVCFDLEDAVAPDAKEAARQLVRKVLAETPLPQGAPGPERCVRINALQGDEWRSDIGVVMQASPAAVMVPKAEDAASVSRFSVELADEEVRNGLHPGSTRLFLIAETALGVLRALEVGLAAGPRLAGFLFGAEDLAADAGLVRTSSSVEVLYARSHVALAAAALDVPCIDQVFLNIQDLAGLENEARQARTLGYSGKMAIHPDQIAPIHRAFTPSVAEVEHALRLLQAAQQAHGVFRFEGKMIDEPLLEQARRTVAVAKRAGMVR